MPAGLFDLRGRGVLVTGGSRGIGKATARTLAAAGADVVIASRLLPASDAGSYVTGAEIVVDGGLLARLFWAILSTVARELNTGANGLRRTAHLGRLGVDDDHTSRRTEA